MEFVEEEPQAARAGTASRKRKNEPGAVGLPQPGVPSEANMCKACEEQKVPGAKFCLRHKQAAQAVRQRLRTLSKKNPNGEEPSCNSLCHVLRDSQSHCHSQCQTVPVNVRQSQSLSVRDIQSVRHSRQATELGLRL